MGAPEGVAPTGSPAQKALLALHLQGVSLLAENPERDELGGLALTIDERGLVVQHPVAGHGPRVLPWSSVSAWRVDHSGASGAVLTVEMGQRSFRFVVTGTDPAEVASVVERFAHARACVVGTGDMSRSEQGEGDGPHAPMSRPQMQAAQRARSRSAGRRSPSWRIALALALVILLALGVFLVLAQSAGLLHLPFLGSSGGVITALAQRAAAT